MGKKHYTLLQFLNLIKFIKLKLKIQVLSHISRTGHISSSQQPHGHRIGHADSRRWEPQSHLWV